MLGGMLALPDDGWSARCDGAGAPPAFTGETRPDSWRVVGAVSHVFTHFALNLELAVYSPEVSASLGRDVAASGGGQWWPLSRLADAGLPTLFAKAARLVWPKD